MSVTTTHRPASTDEIAAEIDRRGQVIEHLEVRNDELTKALIGAERAITEFYRYYTGGETRGSYDGRPEREGLWKAMRAARSTLAALVPAPQPVGASIELTGNTGELIDKMAEAIRGDTTYDDTPWATLPEDRKIGWRGDAERVLAVVKEYLTPHNAPSSKAQEDGR